ncbi:hypothetical protein [Inquilinus limosus]|uniref:hypothetical protein n=1 Tax=Inquilinus limosus TaxID=171674 RepID=UPI0004012709|nr:hypothetical protein [Inquilinus limosus]
MTDLTLNALPRPSLADRVRPWLSGRRALILAAAAIAGGGLWAGWPWLVAAGIAPILLSLAPCAAMCAVGLCTMKARGKAAGTTADTAPASPAKPGDSVP